VFRRRNNPLLLLDNNAKIGSDFKIMLFKKNSRLLTNSLTVLQSTYQYIILCIRLLYLYTEWVKRVELKIIYCKVVLLGFCNAAIRCLS